MREIEIPVCMAPVCCRDGWHCTSSSVPSPADVCSARAPPRWPSGKVSTSWAENPGFDSLLRRGDFPASNHASGFEKKYGTPVATLPGALLYRVTAGTGWSGVNIV